MRAADRMPAFAGMACLGNFSFNYPRSYAVSVYFFRSKTLIV